MGWTRGPDLGVQQSRRSLTMRARELALMEMAQSTKLQHHLNVRAANGGELIT